MWAIEELDLETFAPERHPQALTGAGTTEGAWSRAGASTLGLRNAQHLRGEGVVALSGLLGYCQVIGSEI